MIPSSTNRCLQLAGNVGCEAAARGFNFIFSPLSIRMALSFAAAGSAGRTLDQMLSFLGYSNLAELKSANAQHAKCTSSAAVSGAGHGGKPYLSIANGIWLDKSLALKLAFKDIGDSVFGCMPKSADFQNQAPTIVKEINDWAEEKTAGLIKNILAAGDVDDSTLLVLANAIYFKGTWLDKFNRLETESSDFHLLNGSTVWVPFMTSVKKQFVASFHGFKVLKLPYYPLRNNQKLAMLVFLPDKRDGLKELVHKIVSTPNFMQHHCPRSKVRVDQLMIPKFKFSYNIDATNALTSLGLEEPFNIDKADFSEMVETPGLNMAISKVLHKAAIEVEEEGTKAVAATALMAASSCYRMPDPPIEFIADHPFAFAIIDEVSSAVFFFGHVINPILVD